MVPPSTLTALPGLREKVTGRAVPYPTRSRCRRTPPHRNQNHHENHARQQRRNQPADAHPERRLTQHTDRLGAPARGQVPPRSVVAAGRGRPPGARQAAHDQVSAPNRRVALFDHCGSWRCCRPARGGGVAVDQQGRAGADLGTPGPGGRGQRAGCRCLARPRGDGPGRLRLPVAGASGRSAGPGRPRREAALGPGGWLAGSATAQARRTTPRTFRCRRAARVHGCPARTRIRARSAHLLRRYGGRPPPGSPSPGRAAGR
jgi:hypothetical protein